jgi:hypothetical protein
MWRVYPTAIAVIGFSFICLTTSHVAAVHLYGPGSTLHREHVGDDPKRRYETNWRNVMAPRTHEEFERAVNNEGLALVFFYAPWSHACAKLFNGLENVVAPELTKQRPSIRVVAVDLSVLPEVGKQHRVHSFPALFAFRHGAVAPSAENNFPRHAESILKHMMTLTKRSVDDIASLEELHTLINKTTLVPIAPRQWVSAPVELPHEEDFVERAIIVGYFDDEASQGVFEDAARYLGPYFRMCSVASPQVAKAAGAKAGSVVVYRRWGAPIAQRFEDPTVGSVARFVIDNALAPLAVFDDESRTLIAQRHTPLLLYFSPKRLTEGAPFYADLASLHLDESVNVTVVQANPNTAGRLVSHFLGMDSSITGFEWSIGLVDGRRKYRFDSSFEPTAQRLRTFVQKCASGEWPEFHKSELRTNIAPPGSGIVSDLNYNDFEENIINDTTKDAVVLFYRHGDRACDEIFGLFDALAVTLKGVHGLVVGRVNVAENDYHDAYAIAGYPAILYAARSDKLHPVRMTGVARTVDHIRQFIVEHAVVSLGGLHPSNQTPSAPRVPNGPGSALSDEL